MAIIASAIFGRSAFTFGRSRIIRFTSRVGALSIKQDLQTRPSQKTPDELPTQVPLDLLHR